MQRIILFPLNFIIEFFEGIGRYTLLMASMFRSIGSWFSFFSRTLDQMVAIGTKSIPIVMLTAFFSGMVTSVQSAYQITSSLIPPETIGSIVGESILLELAPVISALVLTGKVGATITAEIGTMRVTEQIDALESLSFDPVSYLILPRVVAGMIMFPILIIIADYCGICDGGGATCGCMLEDALNYDATATSPCLYCDDGSTGSNCCCVEALYGCTDESAVNYNADATAPCLPDCCIEGVVGCMDMGANNYNVLANTPCSDCCEY